MYKLCHETGNTLKGTIYLETEILPRLKCPGVEGGGGGGGGGGGAGNAF